MESTNRITITGVSYLWSYGGGLNILEELLNLTIIIAMALSGFSLKANIFCSVAVLALVHTAIFIFLHVKGVIRKSKLPWHWIECISCLTIAVILTIFSSVILSVLTTGYLITGITGYVTAVVYFSDMIHRFRIATAPVQRYAWTTPNMPDLE